MLSVENHKNVIFAFPNKPVSEQPPDELDKLFVSIHASEQKVIRHRAGIFHIQQVGVVLRFAGRQQIVPRPALLQFPYLKVDYTIWAGIR